MGIRNRIEKLYDLVWRFNSWMVRMVDRLEEWRGELIERIEKGKKQRPKKKNRD